MKKYYAHNKVNLRKGGRTIAKLTEKLFAEKAKAFIFSLCDDDSYVKERLENCESVRRIIAYLPWAIREVICHEDLRNGKKPKTTIGKDFKGISPDWENYDLIAGLRTVKGAPYVVMRVGGDWECPIAIFIYHDGKEFRCYIPTYGNPYRDDLKICYGNYDAHYDPNTETYNDEIKSSTYKKVVLSDDKYLFDELVKDGILDKEKDKDKLRGISRNVDIDLKKCIEDFSERVEVKTLKENYNNTLYNDIISSIAKVVKKQLNESY